MYLQYRVIDFENMMFISHPTKSNHLLRMMEPKYLTVLEVIIDPNPLTFGDWIPREYHPRYD